VVVQGVVFALVYLFSPTHGLIGRRLSARRRLLTGRRRRRANRSPASPGRAGLAHPRP
jgi:hypothetical protein